MIEEARRIAREAQIDEYSILREYAQVVLLKCLYADKAGAAFLAKGGTTIRLLLGGSRFSEDLDFTATERACEPAVERAAAAAAREIPGLVLAWDKPSPTGRTAKARFLVPGARGALSVRLEFSLCEAPLTRRVSVLATALPVSPYPMVVHLDWPEVLAEKVRAIMTRAQGRDIFDLWFLGTKGYRIDWEMAARKLAYHRVKAEPADLRRRIESFPDKDLRQDLLPFLPRAQRPLIAQLKSLVLAQVPG